MIKDFLKEGTLYAVAGVAAKGISLMLIPIFTAYFTTGTFGIIEIIFVFSSLALGVFSWQLGPALIRYLGEYQHDKEKQKTTSTTALVMIALSFVIGTSLLVFFRAEITNLLGMTSKSREKTFTIAMIAMALNGKFLFLGSHLQALRYKRQFALSQFLHAFIGIFVTYFFVITLNKSINGVYYAAIVVFPIVIAYQLYALRHDFNLKFDVQIAKELLTFSLPMLPAGLALIAFALSDRIMINLFSTQEKLGIYSVAFKFAYGFQLIIAGYSMAMHPLVFRNYQDESTKKQLSKLLLGYTVIGALTVISLSIFAKETVIVFTHPDYHLANRVMPLLYAVTWINGFVMFAPGIQLSKKTIWKSIIICFALIVNIALSIWLMPNWGIKGVAMATLTGTIIYVIGLFAVSMRFYPYPFDRKSLLILVSLTILFVMLVTVYLDKLVGNMNLASKFSIVFTIIAFGVFYFIFQNLNRLNQKSTDASMK